MRKLAMVLLAVTAGCGSTVSVGNNVPHGVVSGVLVDAMNRAPLPMVAVQVIAGDAVKDATSNDQGVFTVRDVPAGSFIVSFTLAGYRTVTFQGNLNGAVGNFPVANPQTTLGPIGLIKNDGTFVVRLVDQNGAPAAGINAIARPQVMYVDYSSGFAQSIGNYEVTGMSGADGLITFEGVPNYGLLGDSITDNITVYVPPTRLGSPEQYDFQGIAQTFAAGILGGTVPTILLAGPRTALTVIDSNIDYLRSDAQPGQMGSVTLIPQAGPITIAFNQAIDPKSVRTHFTNEDGGLLTTGANPTVAGNILTISPMGMLPAGQKIALSVRAAALGSSEVANSAREINQVVPFFTRPMAAALTATAKIDSAATPTTVIITFSEAIGEGFAPVAPVAVPCIAFYEAANLDNDTTTTYAAEYNATTSALHCADEVTPQPRRDITALMPDEGPAGGSTGFTNRWKIVLGEVFGGPAGDNGCKPDAPACPGHPAGNSRVRLIFSKAASKGRFVRRASGDAIDDTTNFMISN